MEYKFWSKMGVFQAEQKKGFLEQIENALKKDVKGGKLLPFARQYPAALIRLDEGRLIGDPKYKGSLFDAQSGFIVMFSIHEDLSLTISTTISIKPQPNLPD
ncbi:hypothetical protein [Desulfobacula sp.]|uniref:hypothetical protein n=1 Tax=Desulfobacula sp. TaxID=2593537 RepID=UPI0026365567|nr:hypothetical protein [Desulfobacula sp.]